MRETVDDDKLKWGRDMDEEDEDEKEGMNFDWVQIYVFLMFLTFCSQWQGVFGTF